MTITQQYAAWCIRREALALRMVALRREADALDALHATRDIIDFRYVAWLCKIAIHTAVLKIIRNIKEK
jgi:hypothetical protein